MNSISNGFNLASNEKKKEKNYSINKDKE